jgi:hypothetical protein
MGIATAILLGAILLWIATVPQPNVLLQIVFLVAALWVLWGGYRMHVATSEQIILTRKALLSASGEVLARVDNVARVNRGVFAFKPSNGFLVRLKTPEGPAAWRPGLWWRRGTYLGVGGVVPGGQSRAMAEILTALTLGMLPDASDEA